MSADIILSWQGASSVYATFFQDPFLIICERIEANAKMQSHHELERRCIYAAEDKYLSIVDLDAKGCKIVLLSLREVVNEKSYLSMWQKKLLSSSIYIERCHMEQTTANIASERERLGTLQDLNRLISLVEEKLLQNFGESLK